MACIGRRSSFTSPSETITLSDKGDVIFDCPLDSVEDEAEGTLRIRVESCLMRAACRTFSAMLGPVFREGQNLSSEDPPVIPLPDDDGPAFVLICAMLHGLDPDEFDGRTASEYKYKVYEGFRFLENMALIVDKYGLAKHVGIRDWYVEETRRGCYDRIPDPAWKMSMAYLFADQEFFYSESRQVLRMVGERSGELPSFFPTNLEKSIRKIACRRAAQLGAIIRREIAIMIALGEDEDNNLCMAAVRMGKILLQLEKGVLRAAEGVESVPSGLSCQAIMDALTSLDIPKGSYPSCKCTSCRLDLKDVLVMRASSYLDFDTFFSGLCLECCANKGAYYPGENCCQKVCRGGTKEKPLSSK